MAEGEDFVRDLQLKIASMPIKRCKWHEIATRVAKVLETAEGDLAPQSTLREAALEKMFTRKVGIAEFQERLTAKSAELAQLL